MPKDVFMQLIAFSHMIFAAKNLEKAILEKGKERKKKKKLRAFQNLFCLSTLFEIFFNRTFIFFFKFFV